MPVPAYSKKTFINNSLPALSADNMNIIDSQIQALSDFVTTGEIYDDVHLTGTVLIDGLENIDNTSDANKPVSTAQQTALNLKANSSDVTTSLALKANLASPTLTGTPAAPTQIATDRSTKLATTEFVLRALEEMGMNQKTYSTPGTYTFTVPAGVSVIEVEMYAAGGDGGYLDGDGAGGGGAGAWIPKVMYPKAEGSNITIVLSNSGSSSFDGFSLGKGANASGRVGGAGGIISVSNGSSLGMIARDGFYGGTTAFSDSMGSGGGGCTSAGVVGSDTVAGNGGTGLGNGAGGLAGTASNTVGQCPSDARGAGGGGAFYDGSSSVGGGRGSVGGGSGGAATTRATYTVTPGGPAWCRITW